MVDKYENITDLWNWACEQEQSPTAWELNSLITGMNLFSLRFTI